jgi:hypothetical protein
MDSIEILLHLRKGDNKTDRGYWWGDKHFIDYCPNHRLANGVCPNCFYTKDGEPLVYLREKEIEDASIRL